MRDLRGVDRILDEEDQAMLVAYALVQLIYDLEMPPVTDLSVRGALAFLGLRCPRFGTEEPITLSPAARQVAEQRIRKVTTTITASGDATVTTSPSGMVTAKGSQVTVTTTHLYHQCGQWSPVRGSGGRKARRRRNGKH